MAPHPSTTRFGSMRDRPPSNPPSLHGLHHSMQLKLSPGMIPIINLTIGRSPKIQEISL